MLTLGIESSHWPIKVFKKITDTVLKFVPNKIIKQICDLADSLDCVRIHLDYFTCLSLRTGVRKINKRVPED